MTAHQSTGPVILVPRRRGEPAGAWVARLARAYITVRPEALLRLSRAEAADYQARSSQQRERSRAVINNPGGQDSYPRFGAGENDIDTTEASDD
jgi:hypothetical protein